jgi:hypothetical protein
LPLIVIVLVPGDADPLADSVSVMLDFVELGEKLAVTPFGNPDAARLTLPVNPPVGETVIMAVALPVCFKEMLLDEAARVNPGVVTTRTTDAVAGV